MSGECENCGCFTFECVCASECISRPLSRRQENAPQHRFEHLNCETIALDDNTKPPAQMIGRTINVNGREEHETIIRDTKKCEELGLDQIYEKMVYLKRWGGYLDELPAPKLFP